MTIRQILRALRQRNPDRLYRSSVVLNAGQPAKVIVSKPDFDRVPYDKLHDYWHFEAWAAMAEYDLHIGNEVA